MTNMRRIFLSMLVGLVLSLFAASISTACSTPGLLGGASWAPNATVGVATTGVPSVVTTAIANWNLAFTAFGICDAPTLIASSSTGTPKITMSYVSIPNVSCPTPQNPHAMCAIRGVTQFQFATYSGGYLSTVPIHLNTQLTVAAAIIEVAAHEIGHTFGLNDCNGCALNSTVMESNPTGGPFTVNSVVGTPGPTSCDVIEVAFVKSPGYLCPQSTCPNPQGQPPTGCSNAQWDTVSCTWSCSGSPIIIDISGQGFSLTNAANGVTFDISGTGHPVQMGWTAQGADNAFLALPGADGAVHNGKQLFGNFTPQPKSTTPNGFAALAVYDLPANGGNGDGVIDAKDAIFSSLRLWIDTNHDGISQPEEIHTLSELGVTSISLDYHEDKRQDEYGNVFRYRAKINPDDTDPSHVGRIAYDVFFVLLNPATTKNLLPGAVRSVKKCPVPSGSGDALLSTGKK